MVSATKRITGGVMKRTLPFLAASLTRSASRLRRNATLSTARLVGISAVLLGVLGAALVMTTFLLPRRAHAAACTSSGTGNWSAGATWSNCLGTGGVPAGTDPVTIRNGDTVTVDIATAGCASLDINTGNNRTGT